MPTKAKTPDAIFTPKPCRALPDTKEKLRVLARRVENGEFLFHPRDPRLADDDERIIPIGDHLHPLEPG